MKPLNLGSTISTILISVTPTLAGLRVKNGVIMPLGHELFSLDVIDNGLKVCSAEYGWQIDQDGHYLLYCLPGYIYACSLDARIAWYRNPVGGDMTVYWMDLSIMMLNGKEKSKKEFEAIFDAAGLEIVKIWSTYGALAQIECRLKSK